jgi:uroporphyrinogen decarboxylase
MCVGPAREQNLMSHVSPRQRVLNALDRNEPDRVPADLGTVASGVTAGAYEKLRARFGIRASPVIWHRRLLAEPDESILRAFEIDTRQLVAERPISEAAGGATDGIYRDDWGTLWKALPDHPYMPTHGPFDSSSRLADLRDHPWPDPTDAKYVEALAESALARRQAGDYAIVMGICGRVFTLGQFMCGFEEWMIRLMQDKPFAAALMDRGLEIQMDILARQLAAVEGCVDVVCAIEDLGMQSGLLISPRLYREMILPRHKKLFGFIRAQTSARLMLHSDGAILDLLGDLIDAGVQVINPVQVTAGGMDATRLKREFGAHLSFWGGIDTQYVLPLGSAREVRDEVRRRIEELAAGGGYVLSPVHNIQSDVEPDNLIALFETARAFGCYAAEGS